MFIVATVRIVIAVLVVLVLLLASVLLGTDVSSGPLAGMTMTGSLVSWLAIRKFSRFEGDVKGSEQDWGGV